MAEEQNELQKFCAAYGSFLEFPELVNGQADSLEKTMLTLLTRGDELMTVVQSVSPSVKLVAHPQLGNDLGVLETDVLPTLRERSLKLQQCYKFIDRMLVHLKAFSTCT
jgi:hypothetical protein